MQTFKLKTGLSTLLILALTVSNAWAARILIADSDQTVSLARPLDCYSAAEITIDTSNPEIYEPDSSQLQTIADTVRAMLSYECPGLSEINITGLIRGLDETVYLGKLSAREAWRVSVATSGSYQANAVERKQRRNWQNNQGMNVTRNETLVLTGLKLGMSIAASIEAVEEAFNIAPQYDPENGMMILLSGGCPADFDLDAGTDRAQSEWKCLKAWFSDKRIPALEQVTLIQVVKTDAGTVKQLLTEKYGTPEKASATNFDGEVHMLWRSKTRHDAAQQSLTALISNIKSGLLVTELTLAEQNHQPKLSVSNTDVGLRL